MEIGVPWLSDEWLFALEKILTAENGGDVFRGPLTVSPGPFCLDTPWPQTPGLFKFLFRWLWEEYEIDSENSTFAGREIKHGLVIEQDFMIDWHFLDNEHCSSGRNTKVSLRQLKQTCRCYVYGRIGYNSRVVARLWHDPDPNARPNLAFRQSASNCRNFFSQLNDCC